jgi:predicted O-methyltransferase YrrM
MNDTDTMIEVVRDDDPKYEFTSDWFSRHKVLWDSLMGELKPKKILEIGAFEGKTTTYLIETCGEWNDLEIFCVDIWDDEVLKHSDIQKEKMVLVKERFYKNIALASKNCKNAVKVHPIQESSLRGLSQIAAQGIKDFDLVYVDGSHIASTVFFDAAMAFQLCRIGGAIIFDDYREDKYMPWIYPKIAIDAWANVHENKIQLVDFFEDEEKLPLEKMYQRYYWKIRE